MAGGIGEASAVVTFLQVGFSLAITLTEYIDTAKEAPAEIASLAGEIESTLGHVAELDILLQENEKTKGWNERGVTFAKKCRLDAETVIDKITDLLRRAGAGSLAKGATDRLKIDVPLLKKINWVRLKPRAEVVKRELERIGVKILLARDMYKVKSSTSKAEQDLAKVHLVAMLKKKRRVKAKLRQARLKEDESLAGHSPHVGFSDGPPRRHHYDSYDSYDEIPSSERRRRRSPEKSSVPRESDREAFEAGQRDAVRKLWKENVQRQTRGSANEDGSNSDISMSDVEELAGRLRELNRKETETRAEQDEAKKEAEREAVKTFKKTIVEEVSKYQMELEESVSQMTLAFDLPDEQVRQFIKMQQAKHMGEEVAKIIEALPDRKETLKGRDQDEVVNVSEDSSVIEIQRRRSGLLSNIFSRRRRRVSPQRSMDVRTTASDRRKDSLQALKAIDWSRALLILASFDGMIWSVIRCNTSAEVLQESLIELERKLSRKSSLMAETMQTLSRLPHGCRQCVDQYLETGSLKKTQWDLILARKHDRSPPTGLRIMRRMSAIPHLALPGQTFLLLYVPSKDKKPAEKKKTNDVPDVDPPAGSVPIPPADPPPPGDARPPPADPFDDLPPGPMPPPPQVHHHHQPNPFVYHAQPQPPPHAMSGHPPPPPLIHSGAPDPWAPSGSYAPPSSYGPPPALRPAFPPPSAPLPPPHSSGNQFKPGPWDDVPFGDEVGRSNVSERREPTKDYMKSSSYDYVPDRYSSSRRGTLYDDKLDRYGSSRRGTIVPTGYDDYPSYRSSVRRATDIPSSRSYDYELDRRRSSRRGTVATDYSDMPGRRSPPGRGTVSTSYSNMSNRRPSLGRLASYDRPIRERIRRPSAAMRVSYRRGNAARSPPSSPTFTSGSSVSRESSRSPVRQRSRSPRPYNWTRDRGKEREFRHLDWFQDTSRAGVSDDESSDVDAGLGDNELGDQWLVRYTGTPGPQDERADDLGTTDSQGNRSYAGPSGTNVTVESDDGENDADGSSTRGTVGRGDDTESAVPNGVSPQRLLTAGPSRSNDQAEEEPELA